MRCPKCRKEVPDGTAICEHCDHILDKSFLGDDFTDEGDESSGEAEAYDEDFEPTVPASDHADPENMYVASTDEVEKEMEALRRRRRVEAPVVSATREPPKDESESLKEESKRVAKDVKTSLNKYWGMYKALTRADKLTIGGSFGLFFFSLFPWVSIAHTEVLIGLEVGGWFSMLLAAALVSLVYLRDQEDWRDKEKMVLYAQAGVGAITILFILVSLGRAGSMTGAVAGAVASPELQQAMGSHVGFGLILCLLCSVCAAVGTFMVFKERILDKNKKNSEPE